MDNGLLRETDKRIGADALAGEENSTDIRNERIGSAYSVNPCDEGMASSGGQRIASRSGHLPHPQVRVNGLKRMR